jgi:hypothetical protein
MNLSKQNMDSIVETYKMLDQQVAKEMEAARNNMVEARKTRNPDAYHESHERIAKLISYGMSWEQTEILYSRITQLNEPAKTYYANWLYDTSRFYRPSLHVDYSASGEGFKYSFSQKMSQRPGASITLPDSSQIRLPSNHVGILAGWGLEPGRVTYQPGEEISMPYSNQTLYAVWENGIAFTDALSNVDIVYSELNAGSTVIAPVPTTEDDSYRFAGWYDSGTRTLIAPGSSYTLKGKGATFEGLWKKIQIESAGPINFSAARVPCGTQLQIGFAISNQGNTLSEGLSVEMVSSSPLMTIIRNIVGIGQLPSGVFRSYTNRFGTNTFIVLIQSGTPSGTEIPYALTITDYTGAQWNEEFTLIVE